MLTRERVSLTLADDDVDRPPVTAWGHDFAAEWAPGLLAASTVARVRRYDWDIVKLQPRASCFAEAFGADYRPDQRNGHAPRLHNWVIRSSADWVRLPPADLDDACLADQVEALRSVAREVGAERPVFQTVFSPFTVASYLAADGRAEVSRPRPDLIAKDQARAVRHLRTRPELVSEALATITTVLIGFVQRSLESGADGIFYAIGGSASGDALSADEYSQLLLPHDLRVLAAAAGVPVVVHLCGARLNFELVAAFPAVAASWAVSADGNPSLAEGRARSGLAVMGGVAEVADLLEGGPTAVVRAVHAAIEGVHGRGLVVAPGCSVPPDAGEASLAALAAAVSAHEA